MTREPSSSPAISEPGTAGSSGICGYLPQADQDVREVDSGRADVDERLAVDGLGLGHLLDDELLRPADPLQDGGSQRPVN